LWNPEHHELALEDIDHTRTKTQSFQTNGICERFHKTVLNEFYRVTFARGGIRNFVFEAYLSEEEEICRRTEGMRRLGRKSW